MIGDCMILSEYIHRCDTIRIFVQCFISLSDQQPLSVWWRRRHGQHARWQCPGLSRQPRERRSTSRPWPWSSETKKARHRPASASAKHQPGVDPQTTDSSSWRSLLPWYFSQCIAQAFKPVLDILKSKGEYVVTAPYVQGARSMAMSRCDQKVSAQSVIYWSGLEIQQAKTVRFII